MAQQRSPLLSIAVLALACLTLAPVFVGPPTASRQALRGSPALEEDFETEVVAPAVRPLASKRAEHVAALSSAALAGAVALASEPAFADYDERQKAASGMMVFVIFGAVVITAGFVLVLTNMYK
mmetsp:Transcript_87297/g.231912  ORF Transcript_87297/g.231912 Transcript_87297/m.231912 type:complete len:124 (-) Transcript_87297:113-484(-)